MENTAKSLSMFPPSGKKSIGVDFQDMSQDFESICWKFYNYRQLESVQKLQSVIFEAMFLSDLGGAYCGVETPSKRSKEEMLMIQFVEMADKYARSQREVEDDAVKKIFY